MSAMTDDYGNDHHLDEEAILVVTGIPNFPGKFEIHFHAAGELAGGGADTFDTAEGKPHSLGRKKASQQWNGTIYTRRTEEIAVLEAWLRGVRRGTPGYPRDVRVKYPTASGGSALTVELEHFFPVDDPESAAGQQKAHERNYQFRYWRKRTISL